MKRSLFFAFVMGFLVLGYNNCAPEQSDLRFDYGSQGEMAGADINSMTCDEYNLASYKTIVYPFVSSKCVACHIEGGAGLGLFASSNHASSFAAFEAAGLSKVSFMATNPAHKPPYTGLQNQGAINMINTRWVAVQKVYTDCVTRRENGGVNESILTSGKRATSIYATQGDVETLTWDLSMAEDLDLSVVRSVPARLSIDVEILYQNIQGVQTAKGYIFSNPVLQLKDNTVQILIEGLFFQINGQAITSQTTYTSLSRVVTGTLPVPLMNARANTLIEPLSNSDLFQIYIKKIVPTSGSDGTANPLTPILRITDRETRSETLAKDSQVDVFILRDASVVKWCLSESPIKPADSTAPCVNNMMGANIVNGWSTVRPTSYTLSAGDGMKSLYLWVMDFNLNINTDPGQKDIILDTAMPTPATISSITVLDSQVANMSVTHANQADVKAWCVIEQNAIRAAPARPGLNDECWSWAEFGTRPTTVGFKEGGSRRVWVYVRDEAGNVSNASNMMGATNPFGAITYAELTGPTSPRAIFTNRCFTCHGTSSNPGFSKLQLFNYTSAIGVANSGVLVSRINNPISPMPNVSGGLMPQRDRDLIKLWTMPEEGGDPLP